MPVLQAADDGLLQSGQLVQLLVLVRHCLRPLGLHMQDKRVRLSSHSGTDQTWSLQQEMEACIGATLGECPVE